MKTILEFCDLHEACYMGRKWAMSECQTMTDVWAAAKPEWLVWVATRPGVLTDRELRLFAVFCARQIEHLLVDQRSKDAIAVSEKFANGEATQEELVGARNTAWDVASAETGAAARAAAYTAASALASGEACAEAAAAAWAAAWTATADWAAAGDWAAAWTATADWVTARAAAGGWAAAWTATADWVTARAAAGDEQADWLRKNTTPNFGG